MNKKLWSFLVIVVLVAQILSGCSNLSAFKPAAKEYSFVILPDTQAMSQNNPANFTKMAKWIVDNQQALNIKMVLHMGDVVNKGSGDEPQYQKAKDALDLIDSANIPMVIAPGNHDYDNMLQSNRNTTLFNKYFGMDRYKGKTWFGGAFEEGKSENVYARMEFEGKKYLFFALEFGPRDTVLAWLESIAAKYPDHEVIVATHTYMFKDGGRTGKDDEGSVTDYKGAAGANDGDVVWEKSFKKIKNMAAVYSGHHFNPNISWQTDLGDNGNVVFQSMQDFQAVSDRAGRIRIVKYIPSEAKVELKVFNTLTGTYEKGDGYDVTYSTKKPADPKQWAQIKYPEVKAQPKTEVKPGVVQITNLDKVKEVVSVANGTNKDINMKGWKLFSAYTEVGDQTYYFPDNFVLKAGATVDIISGSSAAEGEGKLVWNKENNWNNSKPDPAQLFNEKGEMISEVVK